MFYGAYGLQLGIWLLIPLFIFFMFFGCGQNVGKKKLSVEYLRNRGEMEINPPKTILFDFDTNLVANPVLIYQDNSDFIFYDEVSSKIISFDDNILVDVINLDILLEKYGYSGYKQTVFALNSDSIYFFLYKTLFLLNKKQNILEQIDLDLIKEDIAYTPWVGYQPYCVDRENQKLYHHVSPSMKNSNKDYYNCPQFVALDLKTYETSFIDVKAPASFERGKAYGQFSDPLLTIGDDKLIYSYHINTEIFFYDILSKSDYSYSFAPDLISIDWGLKPSKNKKKLVMQFRNENKLHGIYYDNGHLFLVYEEGYDMETNKSVFNKFIYVIDIKSKKAIIGQEFPLYDEGKFLARIINNELYFIKKDLDNEKNELEMDVYGISF